MNDQVLILDNGAGTIKAGLKSMGNGAVHDEPLLISNAIVRSKGDKEMYIGPEIVNCRDHFALHYRLPFDKGYLTDWDTEKAVWDRVFAENILKVEPFQTSLLLTEPYFNLPTIQDTYDQLVFEGYGFQACYRGSSASFIPYGGLFDDDIHPQPECIIVVDSGFSFTHVVPMMSGCVQWPSVRRIDVGGKLLTNHLKEVVSYRHYNMMDQTYIINDVKERCCYVSQSFASDLRICRQNPKHNPIIREYVLPDYSIGRHGYVRTSPHDHSQAVNEEESKMFILSMGNERFTIPEILFNPSDIGLDQSGLAETIADAISTLPSDLQGMFWANIGIIGGNTCFPGFETRLFEELQPLAPVDYEVCIYKPDNPVIHAYKSALAFTSSPQFQGRVVTRAQYLEMGSEACRRAFGLGSLLTEPSGTTSPNRSNPGRRRSSKATRTTGRGD